MKRLLSFVLCFMILFTLVPVSAFAEGDGETTACTRTEGCLLPEGHEGDCTVPPVEEEEGGGDGVNLADGDGELEPEPTNVTVSAIGVTTRDANAKTSIAVGETLQMDAQVLPANATDPRVTWSSDTESVATVSADGLVSAAAEGTARIRATAKDGSGQYGELTVTVTDAEQTEPQSDPAVPTLTFSDYKTLDDDNTAHYEIECAIGEEIELEAKADSNGELSYQWQIKDVEDADPEAEYLDIDVFENPSAQERKLKITADENMFDVIDLYQCVVKAERNDDVVSAIVAYSLRHASLDVESALETISSQSASETEPCNITWVWPLRNWRRISQCFGAPNGSYYHSGTDISAEAGEPIYAAADGKVIESKLDDSMGNYVYVDHRNGYMTVYMHMLEGSRITGGEVIAGVTEIGKVGKTGNSTGNHLHFEIVRGTSRRGHATSLDMLLRNFVNSTPRFFNGIEREKSFYGSKFITERGYSQKYVTEVWQATRDES